MIGSLIVSGAKALLFGGSSAGEKGQNNIQRALSFGATYADQRNYTEEERADDNKSQIANIGNFVKQTVSENSERSITRRQLALLIIRLAVLQTVFSVVVWKLDKEWAKFSLEWFKMWWPLVAGVGVFFFGTHLVRSWNGKKEKPDK